MVALNNRAIGFNAGQHTGHHDRGNDQPIECLRLNDTRSELHDFESRDNLRICSDTQANACELNKCAAAA